MADGRGSLTIAEAEVLVGKAGRVAHVVPESRPFAGAFWAALAAGKAADSQGLREAPPRCIASKRFSSAARWMKALIQSEDAPAAEPVFPLVRWVHADRGPAPSASGWCIQTDASVWGAGGVLRRHGNEVVEHYSLAWAVEDFPSSLAIRLADPAFQAFFELLAILVALVLWDKNFTKAPCLVAGDATGSLQNAINMSGSRVQLVVARELAWRKAKFG